jgi:hypothetical protein
MAATRFAGSAALAIAAKLTSDSTACQHEAL